MRAIHSFEVVNILGGRSDLSRDGHPRSRRATGRSGRSSWEGPDGEPEEIYDMLPACLQRLLGSINIFDVNAKAPRKMGAVHIRPELVHPPESRSQISAGYGR